MEEKILEILIGMKKDVQELKENQTSMQKDMQEIKGELRITKNNVAKILEEQIKMNKNLKRHTKEDQIKYKELDYRLTILEP